MVGKRCLAAVIFVLAAGAADQSFASRIHTGDETGTFHARFCPELVSILGQSELAYTCQASTGTSANVREVMASPSDLAYAQLDIFARELERLDGAGAIIPIRKDDARQCLFAVTKRRELQSFGELSALAPELKFHLPPEDSNSSGTFRILQEIDPAGLGRAAAVQHEASAEDAIRAALASENAVAFFVEFPNPNDTRFTLVRELGGHFVPIIDREILRHHIGGEKVYFAQETQVSNAEWLKSARKAVTACTPMVLFTGAPEKITEPKARQDHEDMIATVRALRTEMLLPQESTFARILARTKELSASSAEKLMQASERAKERARPYIQDAKEVTERAIEAAKPTLDKAKEYGRKFYEQAREGLKGLMDSNSETEPPAAQPEEPRNEPQQ
ncbi:MAG: hypothetical protein DIU57_001555 [Pseudomonadota bacterium]|jgi:hypothetical protein|nr:MAG: hypothetical protein DIU57_13045 [Pseudomonadota bacterium]